MKKEIKKAIEKIMTERKTYYTHSEYMRGKIRGVNEVLQLIDKEKEDLLETERKDTKEMTDGALIILSNLKEKVKELIADNRRRTK